MAKQNGPQMHGRKDTVTKITDINGDVILEIGLHEYTIKDSSGALTHCRINETIRLQDGLIWNPGLIVSDKIYVGVCEQCRQPSLFHSPTHGLVSLQRARQCIDCGTLCCPSHKKLGQDRKWRCLKHHKTYQLKTLLRPIFFERKED